MPTSFALDELFTAIRAGQLDLVRVHLDARLEHADAAEQFGHIDSPQPMHAAAQAGHLDIVKLLVEHGATVYSNPTCSYPAVIRAAWANQPAVVDYFLQEIPHLAQGTFQIGVTCNLAARQGWIAQVKLHLARDPLAVHQRGWIGDTPLHWPSHNGHLEIVRLLLEAGANPNIEENNWIGGTPLHWASERHAAIIRLLVDAGANPNAPVTRPGSHHLGATPLIWCAKQPDDCAEAANALLDCGADPAIPDAQGKTARDYAGPEIAKVLAA